VVHPKPPPEPGGGFPTGEDAVLERIRSRLEHRLGPPGPGEIWIGDDAAVVAVPAGPDHTALLLSTDAVVEGIHFDLALVSLCDVGWKALTVAVSDIAAMGGTPRHALVALGAPPGLELEEVADGLAEAAAHSRCALVGGDLTEAGQLVLAVTVTGQLDGPGPAVLRSGARPGDALFVTGPLGASAAGFRVLRAGDPDANGGSLAAAYRRPTARLEEGQTARAAGASAMMDVSDGLALDLHRLAGASHVGVAIDHVPIAPGATLDEALGGGEDYELLIATADGRRLCGAFDEAGLRPLLRIGVCRSDPDERSVGDATLPIVGHQHRF